MRKIYKNLITKYEPPQFVTNSKFKDSNTVIIVNMNVINI